MASGASGGSGGQQEVSPALQAVLNAATGAQKEILLELNRLHSELNSELNGANNFAKVAVIAAKIAEATQKLEVTSLDTFGDLKRKGAPFGYRIRKSPQGWIAERFIYVQSGYRTGEGVVAAPSGRGKIDKSAFIVVFTTGQEEPKPSPILHARQEEIDFLRVLGEDFKTVEIKVVDRVDTDEEGTVEGLFSFKGISRRSDTVIDFLNVKLLKTGKATKARLEENILVFGEEETRIRFIGQ